MTLVVALCGVGAGVGAVLVALGLRGTELRPRRRAAQLIPTQGPARQLAVAALVSLVVAALTRWPIGSLLAGALVAGWPALFGQYRSHAKAMARTEAVATWTEMVRDTMASGSGLEHAIAATALVAPAPVRAEVATLAGHLDGRDVSLTWALRQFAHTLADPTADLVVAALILATRRRARNLVEVLGVLATSAREDASMRLRVETGRARTRTAARVVTLFTVGIAAGLVLLNRPYLRPYDDAVGQMVLAFVGAFFAVAFVWLVRMGRYGGPQRFLTGLDLEDLA